MPSVGHFLQTYVNNRHNLLFALIIVIAVVISLIPELVLHNAREELLKTIYPKSIDSEASIPSSSERGLSHKQTVFPKFFSTNNIASNRNITKELEEYLENLENYSVLKENVLALSDQLSKIESYQQQQKEEIPTPSTADIESTNKPTEYQEKLQTQYQIMLDKQSHLLTLIKQAKEYQSLQHSQIKQLEQNLTTFMEQHYAEKQYIEHHLQRLQEKLNHYQNILTNSKQQHSFYIDLMNGSNSMSQALVDVNNKIKQVMAYDEKLCKDRINLLKRHQIKFQKEEFEQLIKSTVNEKLLAYASLHETSAPQTSNNSSHRPYDEYSCQPVQKMVQEKADYALLSAGAEVLLAETSPTYVPYELQIKNALHQIAHNLGLEDYFPSEYIPEFESTHQWTEAVGLFYGVGSVQDVLRPDIRLGNCWPMNVKLFYMFVYSALILDFGIGYVRFFCCQVKESSLC